MRSRRSVTPARSSRRVFTEDSARRAIHAADPALLVFGVESMDDVHRFAFWRQELLRLLLSTFGAIAMLLAAVGCTACSLTWSRNERAKSAFAWPSGPTVGTSSG